MTNKTKVSLMILTQSGEVTGDEVVLHFHPHEGDYIDHEVNDKSRLYRVVAVVQPTNPVSDDTTMDVYVIDEGPLNETLRQLQEEKLAAYGRTRPTPR